MARSAPVGCCCKAAQQLGPAPQARIAVEGGMHRRRCHLDAASHAARRPDSRARQGVLAPPTAPRRNCNLCVCADGDVLRAVRCLQAHIDLVSSFCTGATTVTIFDDSNVFTWPIFSTAPLIYHYQSTPYLRIRLRLRKFFGLPKPITPHNARVHGAAPTARLTPHSRAVSPRVWNYEGLG